jgi:hypothetical protein
MTSIGMKRLLSSFTYLLPERKLSFSPISASNKNFNPQNIFYIYQGTYFVAPAVKILIFLDLDEKS